MAGDTSNIRVYLVEDHALLREGLHAMLGSEPGFEVTGDAGSAEEAMRDSRALTADVVLMDVGLPGMNGIEAVRRLRERRPDLRIVMLTASEDGYVLEALEAGAAGYILKTSTARQVVEAIRSAHAGKRPIDPSVTGALVRSMAESRRQDQARLSPRQIQVLQLVATGTGYQEIAAQLFISVATVNREMRAVFDRLGVNDAAHAVSEAYKWGILTP